MYVDEQGVLRSQTRVTNASLPETNKNPILLPSGHPFTKLVIKEYHEKVYHNGVRVTLTAMRQNFWILRGREAVKSVVKGCVTCKKLEGLPFKANVTPPLPDIRVDDSPPFTNTGLDFAGPLFVSNVDSQLVKSYLCLFTCASSRAIHLELLRGLDVKSFLRSFRRFSARRGLPHTLISDNAKTYKSASKEIIKIVLSESVQAYFADHGIHWEFIVEKAPWWGGMWERMIRSVKRCIKKAVWTGIAKI